MNKILVLCINFFVTFCLFGNVSAAWIDQVELDGVVHFFSDSQPEVARYDLNAEIWLDSLTLPTNSETLSAGHVDEDGFYLAFGPRLFRYDSNLENEVFIGIASGAEITNLETFDDLIVAFKETGGESITSFSKATNTIRDQFSVTNTFSQFIFLDFDEETRNIAGFDSRSTPELITLSIDEAGQFGVPTSLRFTGFPFSSNSSNILGFLNNGLIVTNNALASNQGEFLLELPARAIDFISRNDVPILLTESSVISLNSNYTVAGDFSLTNSGFAIFPTSDGVLVFGEDNENPERPSLEVATFEELGTPSSFEPVSPEGITFVADDSFVSNNDILHLFSKKFQTLFRWDIATQSYLTSINLPPNTETVAYSTLLNRIYLADTDGQIDQCTSEPWCSPHPL